MNISCVAAFIAGAPLWTEIIAAIQHPVIDRCHGIAHCHEVCQKSVSNSSATHR